MAGMRLKAMRCAKCLETIASPRAHESVCARSSSMPLTPAPETDWYEVATTRRMRAASCSGLSGITATIVVQFGEATMPRCPRTACALISGTTSGTVGSMRQAFDLSTTTAPAFAIIGAYSFDCAVPAAQIAHGELALLEDFQRRLPGGARGADHRDRDSGCHHPSSSRTT